jgi:dipeptidyl aminopeptidase/acylaminoacyl peptidase
MDVPARARWAPRPMLLLMGGVLLVLLGVALWLSNLHRQRMLFLNRVAALKGTVELKPVGWPWLRQALGEDHMRGWDTLVGLDLADTRVDGRWLKDQKGHLQSLEWIDLNGTTVSRDDLESLASLPRLKQVYLADTEFADTTLDAFGKAHPQLGIIRGRKAIKATKMARRPVKTHSTTFTRFSADGQRLATGNGEGELLVFDIGTRRLVGQLSAHSGWVFSGVLSADARTALTVGTDDFVRLWDVDTEEQLAEWEAPDGDVHAVRQDESSGKVYVAGDGGVVHVLDARLQPLAEMGRHLGPIPSLDLSPDGRRLATVSRDETLRIWDVKQRTDVATLSDHTDDVYAVAYSRDARWLATGGYDRRVIVRDGQTGQPCRTLTGHTDWVFGVAFSPDGATLATGSGDGTIRLWQVSTGKCLRVLKASKTVSGVDFQPQGLLLASSGLTGNLRLWNWAEGTVMDTLRGSMRH